MFNFIFNNNLLKVILISNLINKLIIFFLFLIKYKITFLSIITLRLK